IQVVKPSGTATTATSFAVGTAPGNDNFVNAQVLSGNAGTVVGSSVGATKEPGEPDHAGNAGGSSVWYVWTAPSTGNWRFDTSGSSFDTVLAVYTGSAVAALSLVSSNDDSGGGVTSQVSFDAAGGTSYLIAVDGYDGVSGNIVLNWAFTGNLPAITGFSPPSGGAGTAVTINGANFGGAKAVRFSGVSTPTFTVATSAQIIATVPDGAGTGPISVTTSNGTAQSVTSFIISGNAPANDNFAQRASIVGSPVTVTGSNVGATKEPNEPAHAGNPGGASVWWSWTAPANGTYAITTRGSSFDTILGLYVGSSVSSLALVAANDDGPNMGTASLVSFTATAGTTYQIAVDGYGGASGDIILSVYPAVTPQDVYFTGFESFEGYNTFFTLAGQNGWTAFGAGQNGVVYDYFYDFSQQAYIGFASPVSGTNLFVWQPLDFTPETNTRPVVFFSTYMEI
ncbi:MAG: pre-peptidase C-terminal domain-containing protein, partial [Limisphaerales bacterium]